MLPVADALSLASWAVFAPQAAAGTWYPHSFLAPVETNEPHLSSALDFLDAVVDSIVESGIKERRIALVGFSQGACLSLEYVARRNRPLGGVIGLSGGLIGPPGSVFQFEGTREGLRVFLGCSDVDPHIPVERVRETERLFLELGAIVDTKVYPGMGHTISADELARSRTLLGEIV
jgi:predicted esterase